MKTRHYALSAMVAMLALVSLSCQMAQPLLQQPTPATTSPTETAATSTPISPMPDVSGNQPFKLTGTFSVTNDYAIATYFVEQAVALTDMHGFVIRDKDWELPVDSQVLGYMKVNEDNKGGEYELFLPQRPQGIYNDVDNNGKQDTGVQIFAVSYAPNAAGGPFAEGDDKSTGWPTYLASIRTDSENKDEVTGGKLVIWSPDGSQQFPTGFGSDGLLFTADDPVGLIPAGYSIVNLDDKPFTISQAPEESLTLYEASDVAEKDFSNLSYTESFDKMFEIVKKEYAFNGITGKQPDWDKLYNDLKPRVEKAEGDHDGLAFYRAIRDFTWAFKDGHVGISSTSYTNEDLYDYAGGGYGFALRELDNGKAIATYILDGGPAAKAGMQIGAEIVEFNGKPIKDAISAVRPYDTQSSDFAIRLSQERYLVRTSIGTQADWTFKNPGGTTQTVTLSAISEVDSFYHAAPDYSDEPAALTPVESKIIKQDDVEIGYIRVNSNYDDLNLILRLFSRSLKEFESRDVAGVIIDMRFNAGGAPLGLAGYLTSQEIPLGQLSYYSDKTGKFEPEGNGDKLTPYKEQYSFNNIVTLVGPSCFSACEIESYGFSQVPGMTILGQYSTAGVEAEVSRGQFKLPENIDLQIPTGRFTLPDGSIFLDGKGVQPTVHVPVDETTVLSKDDVVLQSGIKAVLLPPGQGVTPSGAPNFSGDPDAIRTAAQAGTKQFEEKAREQYNAAELEEMNKTFTYTIALKESEDLFWTWGWCADSDQILGDNLKSIQLKFTLNGKDIPDSEFAQFTYPSGSKSCISYYALLTKWPGGEHHAQTVITFTTSINDGQATYPAGSQTFDYTVYVKP
jgi:C-terminal processing protease CtpA/Prc